MSTITTQISPPLDNDALNALSASAWGNDLDATWDFQPILHRSLLYVCAYEGARLVGFVNVAWDGGMHGFLLDTMVHADYQRRGIGKLLVQTAITAARARGIEWLHVDYEPHLRAFYTDCGFRHTEAGLINLKHDD